MNRFIALTLIGMGILASSMCLYAEKRTITVDDVLQNGRFNAKGKNGIPDEWTNGWPNDPGGKQPGTFSLVPQKTSKKNLALLVEPQADAGIFITQVLDLPVTELNGTQIDFKAEIMTEGEAAAIIMVVAVNPEAPVDQKTGLHATGSGMITAASPGEFKEFSATMKVNGSAEFVMIAAGGMGKNAKIFIDNISLTASYPDRKGKKDRALGKSVKKQKTAKQRLFRVGFVNESPQNQSARAASRMLSKIASVGELVNVFFHFRNNASQKKPLLAGHERQLAVTKLSQSMKLDRILTFDFTHANPEAVGTLSPMSDGRKVKTIDAAYASAFTNELLALCKEVKPAVVCIGIEMSIFYDKNPAMWPKFVSLYKDTYRKIKKSYPNTHVTTYFTLEWMVDREKNVNKKHAAVWQQLLPELDSIAFSSYPSGDQVIPMEYPAGYFTAVSKVAPKKPLAVPECGVRSGDSPMFNEDYQAKLFAQMLDELGAANTEFVVAFSMYDQQYLGTSDWYKKVFRSIGFIDMHGEPKKSWTLFEGLPPYKKAARGKK